MRYGQGYEQVSGVIVKVQPHYSTVKFCEFATYSLSFQAIHPPKKIIAGKAKEIAKLLPNEA